jgi:adenylylsulfate kinase-like enzyme
MIYSIIGQSGSGKTTMGKKLHKFLTTERRNWRKDVFHIDEDTLRFISGNRSFTETGIEANIRDAYLLAEYLHVAGCDVVITIMSPYVELRERLKDTVGPDIQEIFLHTSDTERGTKKYKVPNFEAPEISFIDIDTTKKSPDRSFSKLITNLTKLDKL